MLPLKTFLVSALLSGLSFLSPAAAVTVDLGLGTGNLGTSSATVSTSDGNSVTFTNLTGDNLYVSSGLSGITGSGICAGPPNFLSAGSCGDPLEISFATAVDDLVLTLTDIGVLSTWEITITYGDSETVTYSDLELLTLTLLDVVGLNSTLDLSDYSGVTSVVLTSTSLASTGSYVTALSYSTAELPVLPLPAGGFLLLSGLLGIGATRLHKRRQA